MNWTDFLVPIPEYVQIILVVLFAGALLWWKIENECRNGEYTKASSEYTRHKGKEQQKETEAGA